MSHVNDCSDPGTSGMQVGRCARAIVVVDEQNRIASGCDAEAIDVGSDSTRQHDAGAVVIAEYDWPFRCAGCENRALGDNTPEALTGRVGGRLWNVVCDALDGTKCAAVVSPGERCAQKNSNFRKGTKFSLGLAHPFKSC